MRMTNWLPGGFSLRVRRLRQTARDIRERVGAPVRAVASLSENATEADGANGLRTEVLDVRRETRRDVRIMLAWPSGYPAAEPGQFVVVGAHNGARFVRRAYSVCSDVAQRDRVAIACREHPGGALSTKLVRGLSSGDRVEISEPGGRFGAPLVEELAARGERAIVLCAAGSGVTPLVSMLHALRAEADARVSPRTVVVLLGYRERSDALLLDEITTVIEGMDGAELHCAFSREIRDSAASSTLDAHSLQHGRWDVAMVCRTLKSSLDLLLLEDALAFSCGPSGFVETVERAFAELGISRRYKEEFYDQSGRVPRLRPSGSTWNVTYRGFSSDSADVTVAIPDSGTILDAGRQHGLDMAFSCSMGGCAACLVRVSSGDVSMLEPNCLTQSEAADGYVLACVASPRGDVVVEPAGRSKGDLGSGGSSVRISRGNDA